MRNHQYKIKWYSDFQKDALQFVEQNGIINSFQIYNIYRQNYGSRLWEANILQRLYTIISQEPNLFRIDKTIPNSNGIELEGHPKIKQITFFVLSSLSEDEKIEKSEKELNSLILSSTNSQSKKPKNNIRKKESVPKKIDLELKRSSSSTQLISCLSPGFISSKVLRCQILHHFLNDTFGTKPFTIDDIFDKLPIDLYFKIIGSTSTPKIFLQCPMLRFVLLKFFPQRILNAISFNESHKIIKTLLDKLEKEFYAIQVTKDKKYLLRSSLVLSCLHVSVIVFFCAPNSIEMFWRFLEISNRIENNDSNSSNLWLKRWSLKEAIKIIKPETSMIYKFINTIGYQNTFSIRKPENLVSKYGYELIFLSKFLPNQPDEISEEDQMIQMFCTKFKWENPKIETKLPHEIQTEFLDENYYFTDLVAQSSITIGGVIHQANTKWQDILLLINDNESLKWRDLSNKFNYLFSTFLNIRSRFNYTSALTIAKIFQNSQTIQFNYFELTEKEILSHFNLINKQLVVKNEIGELSEAFKRFLLCSLQLYCTSDAELFFSEYIWSYSTEAQLLLKMSGIYSQNNAISDQKSKPKKQTQIEKKLFKDFYFYNEMQNLKKMLIFAGQNPKNEIPITINDTSTTYFLLHQDIFVENYDYHLIDFVIENEKSDNEISIKSILNISTYISTLEEFNGKFNLRFHCLPFPQLPSFSIPIDSTLKDDEKPKQKSKKSCEMKINNCVNHLYEAIREFYLISSQTNNFQNGSLNPFVYYAYGFILHSEFDGLDLNVLRNTFGLFYNSSIFDELIISLEFLEEFNYIKRKQSSNALPIYVSDAYFLREEKEFYWTNIYHQIDEKVLIKQYSVVFERIELNPGINIFDLYLDISYLSISNLLDIINVLILDEAIYMTTLIHSNEDPLFEDPLFLPNQNLSIDHILVLFYISNVDPTISIPIIQLYPTTQGAINNQCLL